MMATAAATEGGMCGRIHLTRPQRRVHRARERAEETNHGWRHPDPRHKEGLVWVP